MSMTKILGQIYFMKHAGGQGRDGGNGLNDPWMPSWGWDLMVCTQSRGASSGLILALQRSAVRVVGWWRGFSASTHDAYHLLCRLMPKPQRPPSLTKKGILVCS